jgi:hypothetical protein
MPLNAALLTLLLLGASSSASPASAGAAPPTTPPATPPVVSAPVSMLRFTPETLDLGEMISGKPKTGTLTITNITNAPLTIAKIKGACGCTTISAAPKDAVPAGGSFTVQITVDPGSKTGIDLSKAVHFQIDGAGVQSMNVIGHVKTVVRVSPDVVDATLLPEGADAIVTLESVDAAAFSITAIEPVGFVDLPSGAHTTHQLTIDWKKWAAAGRPAKLTVLTDKTDATTLVVPIKASPAIAMFRLPAALPESTERLAIESAQDQVIHAIDDAITVTGHTEEFKVRIHRETGMLFVHGTEREVTAVRQAVRALPASAGVRETTH